MQTEYPFHTAFLFLFMTVTGIRLYFAGYADAASGVRQTTKGEGSFRVIRFVLGTPVFIGYIAYMVWPPLMQWSQVPLSPSIRWWGVPFGLATIVMLVWVHKHLSRNFTGTVQIRPQGHLVTSGPYNYVRHPMYIAFQFLGISMFLLTANWFLAGGFFLIIAIVIVVRTPIEERALEKAYGEEYRKYKARTGALFPRMH